MVVYLLEKSRLTYQQPLERCYHAFYNLMSDQVPKKRHQSSVKFLFGQVPDLKAKCLLSNDIKDYWFVSQGKLTVPSIDDKEDMQFADEAYDILGFTKEEKYNVYKESHSLCSVVLLSFVPELFLLSSPDISICLLMRLAKDPLSG